MMLAKAGSFDVPPVDVKSVHQGVDAVTGVKVLVWSVRWV